MIRALLPGRDWLLSLRIRMIVMMSLALLPIGLIAIVQTRSVTSKARENAELALLLLTEQAALEERLVIHRAFGAAQALGARIPEVLGNAAACSDLMADFVAVSDRFSFAGFLPPSGLMTCSSAQRAFDFFGFPGFQDALADPRPRIEINVNAPLSGTSVVIVSQPVTDTGGDLLGFVSISIPHTALEAMRDPDAGAGRDAVLVDLMTFNETGDILTSTSDIATADRLLPRQYALADLVLAGRRAFTAVDRQNSQRIFAVAPIEEGRMYVLGIWDARSGLARQIENDIATSAFPAIMWLVSLGVALFAVHRLVIRHINRLGAQMTAFAANRKTPADTGDERLPTEVRLIRDAFADMTQSILQDEAALENAVREKNVLVREIHHRVKNNLQLIASIINLQIREVHNPESRQVLRRIQDRVVSLATIHRDLYQTTSEGLVNVGHLVRDVVTNTIELGQRDRGHLRISQDIEDLWLYPDQAVPMSLLAAEAATNAVKYVGSDQTGDPWVKVGFKALDGGRRQFVIANSIDASATAESTGMGSKLIKAFAIQLGAEIALEATESTFAMTVTFEARAFSPQSDLP